MPKCKEIYHKICWETNTTCAKCGEKNKYNVELICKKCRCKYLVSNKSCPHCGVIYENNAKNTNTASKTALAIISSFLSILMIVGVFYFNQKYVHHEFQNYTANANADPLLVMRKSADFLADVLVKI